MRQSNGDAPPSKILVVDDDHDTADLMQAVLTDEGYAPSVIYAADSKSVREAVTRLVPDCVLLDSSKEDASQYGESWQIAARIAAGERNIPVVMMTGHVADADEAVAGTSKRARAADFAAVIKKPFELDEFLSTLSDVLQKGTARRASEAEIVERLSDLQEHLIAAGARGISTSSRRVWAIFHAAGDDDLVQIYWWEKLSLYLVARYSPDGAKLEPLGQFTDVDAAVAVALP